MKWMRTRTALAIIIASILSYIIMMSGCASVTRERDYDGALELLPTPSDSALLVPITIDNTRSNDLGDPVFYLIGNGRHSLGRVPDLSKRRVFIDSRWLTGADGTFQIYVHYVGLGDLYYERMAWRPGESISVQLTTPFNSVAMWSHR